MNLTAQERENVRQTMERMSNILEELEDKKRTIGVLIALTATTLISHYKREGHAEIIIAMSGEIMKAIEILESEVRIREMQEGGNA